MRRKNWLIKMKYEINFFSIFQNLIFEIKIWRKFVFQIFKKIQKLEFSFFKKLNFWIILSINGLKLKIENWKSKVEVIIIYCNRSC